MKNLLFLGACLWALAGRAQAQNAPDIVLVRIYEGAKATAIITRGEGRSEKVEFDLGVTDKRLIASSEGYYKLLARLYSEGYFLQATMPTAASATSSFLTLLFAKK